MRGTYSIQNISGIEADSVAVVLVVSERRKCRLLRRS